MFQLDHMFKNERGQYKTNLLKNEEVTQSKHKITFEYLKNRGDLVSKIMSMAQKFKQRSRTAHLAVELMDRLFMDDRVNK